MTAPAPPFAGACRLLYRILPSRAGRIGRDGKAAAVRRSGTSIALGLSASERESMLEEFKKFALKGNVIDLAIGIIIGAAFGRIVESVVGDIFMPIVGAVTGGLDFSNHFLALSKKVTADTLIEAKKQGAVLAWGSFLTIAINFLIVAGVMFGLVSLIQRLRQKEKEEAKPAAAPPR